MSMNTLKAIARTLCISLLFSTAAVGSPTNTDDSKRPCQLKKPLFIGYATPLDNQILLVNAKLNRKPEFGFQGACKSTFQTNDFNVRIFNAQGPKPGAGKFDFDFVPLNAVMVFISPPAAGDLHGVGAAIVGYGAGVVPIGQNREIKDTRSASEIRPLFKGSYTSFLKENEKADNHDVGTLQTHVSIQEGYITSIFLRAPVPNIENPFWCSSFPVAAVKNQELCVVSAERAIIAGPVNLQQTALQENFPYKNPSIKDPAQIEHGSCSREAQDHAIRAFISEFSKADLKNLKPVITAAKKTKSMGGRPQIEEYFITVEDSRRGQKSITIKTTFRGHEGKGCLIERL